MEYACASVVVYDKKNNGTLVHVHRVLVACSQKNRDFSRLLSASDFSPSPSPSPFLEKGLSKTNSPSPPVLEGLSKTQ